MKTWSVKVKGLTQYFRGHSSPKNVPHEGKRQKERNIRQGLYMTSVNGFTIMQRK